MKLLTPAMLDQLTANAAGATRLRSNQNVHTELADPIQRLAIAMEPSTYVRPHRHPQTWELLIALRGQFVFTVFDDAGNIVNHQILGGENGTTALEIPAGTWHTVTVTQPGSIVFEVKHGPYLPTEPADFASWSAPEGSAEAKTFLTHMEAIAATVVGQA